MKAHREKNVRRTAAAQRMLIKALLTLENEKECRDFLNDLCTPAELEALVDRWSVVAHLENGVPYRKIHELTGVSVTTISRVARFLTAGNGGYRTVLTRLANR